MTIYAQDSFTRTVSPGFGTADVGGAYTHSSTTSVSVDGAKGVINATTSRLIFLADVSVQDVDITVKYTLNGTLATGVAAVVFRLADNQNFYRAGFDPNTGSSTDLEIHKFVANVGTAIGTGAGLGPTVVSGDSVWLRAQAEGINPTTIRFKVWKDGTSEPGTWGRTETDSESVMQAAGAVGIRTNVGSTPAYVDDYLAESIGGAPAGPGGIEVRLPAGVM